MATDPYREPVPTEREGKPVTSEPRLGAQVLGVTWPRWRLVALPPLLTVGVLYLMAFLEAPRLVFEPGIAMVAIMLVAFWLVNTLRSRFAMTLHVDGIAIERRRRRETVLFEDVDEVWYETNGRSEPPCESERCDSCDAMARRSPCRSRGPMRSRSPSVSIAPAHSH